MLLIIFDLCWSSHYSTIQDIADKYYVSRGTINTDMVALKKYCINNGIRLISQRGNGIYIDAAEMERRRYLSKIIRDFTPVTADSANCESSIYSQWFEKEELNAIKIIVTEVEEAFETYLDDIAFEALVIHIALTIKRFKLNSQYAKKISVLQIEKNSLQYEMALGIVNRINREFNIKQDL